MLRKLHVIVAALLTFCIPGHGKEVLFEIHPQEPWSAYFGGVEKIVHVDVTAREAVKARAAWTLSVEGRVVERKELALTPAPAQPATFDIPIRLPEVKEGVVMPALLMVALTEEGKGNPEVSWEHPLWIYPQNAFAGRTKWLEALHLVLFDPEGKTAKILEAANVPFKPVKNIDALAETKKAIVVIGEGVSFHDYRSLPETMVKLANEGVPVLCLAPVGGEFPFPGSHGNELPFPSAISLKQHHIIAEFNKKLDSMAWPPDGKIVATRIQLKGDHTGVMAEVTKENEGWPWVEMRFDKASLVICGFPIIEKWEAGPTPRFLLARILEYVSGKK